MAESFFGSEYDSATAAPEPDQFGYAQYEEQPYTEPYVDLGQSNGALSHDDFSANETSVFGVVDHVPAAEYDPAVFGGADYANDASVFGVVDTPATIEPEVEDPRVLWNIENRNYLAQKDQAERAGKAELLDKAREYFEQFYQSRGTTLQKRKDGNREDEKEKTATALPQGNTAWEKVHSLLNFNSDVPTKDVSRYKSTLFTCKNNNVPVHTPAVEAA